jgi:hypothetical protein
LEDEPCHAPVELTPPRQHPALHVGVAAQPPARVSRAAP